MLSRSATAKDSTVNRNVIANTRTGIPIQRGPSELVFAMLLSYTIGKDHRDWPSQSAPRAHTLQYWHVANRLPDRPQPGGGPAKQPRFTAPYPHLLRSPRLA